METTIKVKIGESTGQAGWKHRSLAGLWRIEGRVGRTSVPAVQGGGQSWLEHHKEDR